MEECKLTKSAGVSSKPMLRGGRKGRGGGVQQHQGETSPVHVQQLGFLTKDFVFGREGRNFV